MWHEGTIGIPMKGGKYTVAHYTVKSYDEGSGWGIDGGRISKLSIKMNGRFTANYDRGWDIEPEDEATQMALMILLKEFN